MKHKTNILGREHGSPYWLALTLAAAGVLLTVALAELVGVLAGWLMPLMIAAGPACSSLVPMPSVRRLRRRGGIHERGKYGVGQYGGRRPGYTGWARYNGVQRERSGFDSEPEALGWAAEKYIELRLAAEAKPATRSNEPQDQPIIEWLENTWLPMRENVRRKKDNKKLGRAIKRANSDFVLHFRAYFGERTWTEFIQDSEAITYLQAHRHDQASASKAFNDAIPNNLLGGRANPFSGKRATKSAKASVVPLTPQEMKAFLDLGLAVIPGAFRAAMWVAMTSFAAWTGLRPSEILGSQPRDIDAKHHAMDVVAGYDGGRDPINRPEPKWGSTGLIVLSTRALNALADRPVVLGSPWLFHYETGEQWGYRPYLRWFKKVAVAFGRPELTPMHTRHFAATVFHIAGWDDKKIAKQFRHHDDGETVREYYMHLYEGYERAEMLRLIESADVRLQHFIDRGVPWAVALDPVDDTHPGNQAA